MSDTKCQIKDQHLKQNFHDFQHNQFSVGRSVVTVFSAMSLIHLVEVLAGELSEVGNVKPQIEPPGPDFFIGHVHQESLNVVANIDQTSLGL